jgi:organic hydroperoxide reductase OsmC/OhrA
MTDIQTSTVSEEGYTTRSQVDEYELTVDAANENGPTAQQVLVADYAACFLPAVRVGGRRVGHDDLGRLQIDADADLDEDDDVSAIRFTLHVEAAVDDEALGEIVARAEDICHVHDALREELHAEIDAYADAF